MIGMKPDGTPVDSVLDVFKKSGKKVGIISTNTVTDATPVATPRALDRAGQEDIARQILDSEIDVILGGGAKYFSPDKQEGVNLVNKFKEKGYSYVTNKAELASNKSDKLLGLFHDSYMNYKSDRDDLKSQEPTLTEMTMTAIKALSKEQEGFFLMSEGARIDHASHAADITSVWKETIEFDNAVKAAVEWARKDGETLVLVLADHETMGISATEPMDIDGLKKIQVSAEFMAAQLKMDKATGASTPSSVKEVFKKYANIS